MKFLAVLFFTLFLFGFNAQLKREVLFRLQPNEVLFQNEYTSMIASDGTKKFSALVRDTMNNSYRLIFNGKTIERFSGNEYGPNTTIKSIDLNKSNGYSYITYGKNSNNLNIEGKKIPNLEGSYFVGGYYNDQNNDYYYSLLGERYLTQNGKAYNIQGKKEYKIFGENILWIEDYKWESALYSNARLHWNTSFLGIFNIRRGGDYNPIINVDENGYAFCYTQNDANYISFNGSVSRIRSDSRIWNDFKIVGKDYFFILENGLYKNDVLVQNFNMNIRDWDVNTKGDVLYTDGESIYLNSLLIEQNNKVSSITDINIDNNGNVSYTYFSPQYYGCYFEVKNQTEKRFSSYLINAGAELSSVDGVHHLKSKWNYDYVVIDGTPYGNSPALTAWFDEKKKCFYWNSFEKNELVLYQFIP